MDGETLSPKPLFKFRHVDARLEPEELRERLSLQDKTDPEIQAICNGVRSIINGRAENLQWCRVLGQGLAGDITKEDLFL